MEPQPQLQPIQPRPEMPYADPATRPLDLKPAPRRPLDLKPAPRRPLDLRPRPSTRPGAGATPQQLLDYQRSNPFAVVEPIINNPVGYAPGKAVVGMATTFAERATDPSTFNPATPFQTIDVPGLAMPADLADETPLSPTSSFNPDAIDSGPQIAPGSPAVTAEPGSSVGVAYNVRTFGASQRNAFTGALTPLAEGLITGFIGKVTVQVVVSYPSGVYSKDAIFTGANGRTSTFTLEADWAGGYGRMIIGGQYQILRADGQQEPTVTPEIAPTYAPNPARSSSAELPAFEFAPFPDDAFMPGFAPSGSPLIEPPPAGEIVPYQPEIIDITDQLRPVPPHTATPPGKEYRPPYMPDMPDRDDPTTSRRSRWRFRWPFGPVKRGGSTGTEMTPPTKDKDKPVVIGPPARECCGDDTIRKEGKQLRDLLRDLADVVGNQGDCMVNANIPTWLCEIQGNQRVEVRKDQTANDLSQAFTLLAAEVAAIRKQLGPCADQPPAHEQPSVLQQGTATDAETVWYVSLPEKSRQVELIITGTIPKSFRLYDTTSSGEQQAKFGSLTISYDGSAGGKTADAFHQFAWTRRTTLYVGEPLRPTRYCRVHVKAGLSWTLYDTGLRN